MNLLVKFPTRERPGQFIECMGRYQEMLSGKHNVAFLVALDEDDPTCGAVYEEMNRKWGLGLWKNVHLAFGTSVSKIHAVNRDINSVDPATSHPDMFRSCWFGLPPDVVLLASDDMWPEAQGWDDIVAQDFARWFPDYMGAVRYEDGLRQDLLITVCCMGWPLYKRFGYLYHPDYYSVYPDNEQTRVLWALDKVRFSDTLLLRHRWNPTDAIGKRNENREVYARDEKVFRERAARNFDIEKVGLPVVRNPLGWPERGDPCLQG